MAYNSLTNKTIKANVKFDEYRKIAYFKEFKVVNEDYLKSDEFAYVEPLKIDSSNDYKKFDYDYYRCVSIDDEGYESAEYVCVYKDDDYDE